VRLTPVAWQNVPVSNVAPQVQQLALEQTPGGGIGPASGVSGDGDAPRGSVAVSATTDGGDEFAGWQPPTTDNERAFVLAGGGATGIAWEAGVIMGLRDGGVDVREADTMIGTSAGSMVAAHLRVGTQESLAFARIREGAQIAEIGRLGPADASRYLRAQMSLDKKRGRALVGQAALAARTTTEEEWLKAIGLGLVGKEWPDKRLFITAVDARTGTSVVFDNSSGVPLERAVAASCAVPGVFPAVEVGGRRYVDGGLRTVANADLAVGHRRVLALSPYPVASHLRDLPARQLRSLRPASRTHLVVPDARDLWAMGANPLDFSRGADTFETARAHGQRIADRVGEMWLA